MNCNIQLPKYKTTERLIWSYFDAFVTCNQTSFGECKKCRKQIYFEEDLTPFGEHLELHDDEWSKYLSELTEANISEQFKKGRNVLKCSTLCSDPTKLNFFCISLKVDKARQMNLLTFLSQMINLII